VGASPWGHETQPVTRLGRYSRVAHRRQPILACDRARSPCAREIGNTRASTRAIRWAYSKLRMGDGNSWQAGIAVALLLISIRGPRTMLRFLGGVALAAAAVAFAWATQSQTQPLPAVAKSDQGAPILHKAAGVEDEWFNRVFESLREPEPKPPPPRRPHEGSKGGTYKTLCVRLCDGFYFPISHSTPRWRFAADAAKCEQRCPAGARLFVHLNPGEGVDDMVDLDGRHYRSLPSAFLHQSQYVADCTCHGNPWDEAAIARHRAYAEATKRPVGGKALARMRQ
jgi:hypothetical protein